MTDEIKDKLTRYLQLPAVPAAPAQAATASGRAGLKLWMIGSVAAAAALLAVFAQPRLRATAAAPHATAIQFQSAAAVLVLAVRQDANPPAATIESLHDFSIGLYQSGDRVNHASIGAIANGAVLLTDQDGSATWTPAASRAAVDRLIATDIHTLRTALGAQPLPDTAWQRLEQFSRLGSPEAMRWLAELAAAGASENQRRAQSILYAGTQSKILQMLIKQAADPGNPYRLDAVTGLGKLDSPAARAALRTVAVNPRDPHQLLALQTLVTWRDTVLLTPLETLRNDATLDAVMRASIDQAYQDLLK